MMKVWEEVGMRVRMRVNVVRGVGRSEVGCNDRVRGDGEWATAAQLICCSV